MNFGVRIRSQAVVFDRLDRKNWRPITLLNVDYKLCARTLAGRLLRVIHNAVEKDQTCGAPGRYIGENVSLLRDLVDYTSETDTPAAILSLDQEKAFDRVDWNFMFNTLSRIGFGPSFIRWVRLLYTDFRSCVLCAPPTPFPSVVFQGQGNRCLPCLASTRTRVYLSFLVLIHIVSRNLDLFLVICIGHSPGSNFSLCCWIALWSVYPGKWLMAPSLLWIDLFRLL